MTLELVIIESPFKGEDWTKTKRNILYARLCVADSLNRGEAPFASHLFYTQTGILDDSVQKERNRGINSGIIWGNHAETRAVYKDYGISKGMQYGIDKGIEIGQRIDYRSLGDIGELEKKITNLEKSQQFIEIANLRF